MQKIAVVALVVLATLQQSAALKCYFCDTACEVAQAQQRVCGQTIGPNHEAICTVERPKSNEKATSAIRRCQVVNKGNPAVCASDNVCDKCTTDFCNAAPVATSLGVAALVGVVAAVYYSTN